VQFVADLVCPVAACFKRKKTHGLQLLLHLYLLGVIISPCICFVSSSIVSPRLHKIYAEKYSLLVSYKNTNS